MRAKGISVKYDNRTTYKPGWKFAEYELKGVPLRIAMGPRDLENNTAELARRDTLKKKTLVRILLVGDRDFLVEIQDNLFQKLLILGMI